MIQGLVTALLVTYVAQVAAAEAMVRALRLPEDAPEDAQPGRSLPAWAVGTLPNPWLQRHYQARLMHCLRTWQLYPSSTQSDEEGSHKLVKVLCVTEHATLNTSSPGCMDRHAQ